LQRYEDKLTGKSKFLLSCVFFGGLGIICLYLAVDLFVTGKGICGQELLLNEYDNPIIKYSIANLFVAFSIPAIAFPILQLKGIFPLDYNNSSRFEKAKGNFIILTLSLPAALIMFMLFYLKGCDSGLNCNKAIIAGALFFGFYIYTIIILFTHKV
jgi:hypothetical protein